MSGVDGQAQMSAELSFLSNLKLLRIKVVTPHVGPIVALSTHAEQRSFARLCFTNITALVLLSLECYLKGWMPTNYFAAEIHVDGSLREQRWVEDSEDNAWRYDFEDLRRAYIGVYLAEPCSLLEVTQLRLGDLTLLYKTLSPRLEILTEADFAALYGLKGVARAFSEVREG